MDQNAITGWLKRKRRAGWQSAILYALATLLGGAFVLVLTIAFLFVLTKLILLQAFPLSPLVNIGSALGAILATGFIFADAIRARRDDFSFLPGWLLREYISIGPRLILEGWPCVKRAQRFARLDLETCTNVLTFLARQGVPTSRPELLRHFPEVQWHTLTTELGLLSGVIFFRPDGLRVILTTPLRLELRTLLSQGGSGETPASEPPPPPVEAPHKLSPAEILGVNPAATLSQIKIAYRARIKECHPDRFATLDEPSRALAEEWTKSLNAAYETLVAEARKQSRV